MSSTCFWYQASIFPMQSCSPRSRHHRLHETAMTAFDTSLKLLSLCGLLWTPLTDHSVTLCSASATLNEHETRTEEQWLYLLSLVRMPVDFCVDRTIWNSRSLFSDQSEAGIWRAASTRYYPLSQTVSSGKRGEKYRWTKQKPFTEPTECTGSLSHHPLTSSHSGGH